MLAAHRVDHQIIEACRRFRRPVTASEIASEINRNATDVAPHPKTIERHLMGLERLSVVEVTAVIRDDRAIKVWKIRDCPNGTGSVQAPR